MEKFHPVDAGALRPGTEVGPWRLVSVHRKGAYGALYRAEKAEIPGTGTVALKLALHPMDERFEREVELLSRIDHAHVPKLLDAGEWTAPDGARFPYVVMEWVEGEALYEWARDQRLTSRSALKLLAQVARALEALHAVEGVHRDIKGDNLLVAGGGRAVLVDFGSGCYQGARVLTHTVMPPGTPRYWSPEAQLFQWRFGRRTSARYEARPADDVYALGVMAYRLVTGSYPPEALEWEEALDSPQPAPPERMAPESLVTVCPGLAALIRQMLANEPTARGSAAQIAQALERVAKTAGRQANRPITRRQGGEAVTSMAQPVKWRPAVAWLGWIGATALSVLLVVSHWGGEPQVPEERSAQALRGTHAGGEADGGTTALGDVASTATGHAQMPEPGKKGLGMEMPKTPFPGQRQPPCEPPEIEANGGCWVLLGNVKPPCGPRSYEWKKGCYWPSFPYQRPATSEHP
ncbi:serine/threonine-protein kinase [Hyalangium rubrum]|uniref:Serine/threonine-protein kinase n=1 Tax=Hyalangium rubrum TaxID=3103134 RepID=A0ABU5H4T9_9BACT|nr:serine/threonine-protein kinase [Hyalangium sp. s54d21]MDY7227894.1 serine/threonine-protein kinase [Hyalangium sp. s54d21]